MPEKISHEMFWTQKWPKWLNLNNYNIKTPHFQNCHIFPQNKERYQTARKKKRVEMHAQFKITPKNSRCSTNQTMRWKKGKIEEELTQVAAWSFASYWAEESLLVATQKKEFSTDDKSLKIERRNVKFKIWRKISCLLFSVLNEMSADGGEPKPC